MDTDLNKCEHKWGKTSGGGSNPRAFMRPITACSKCGMKKEDYDKEQLKGDHPTESTG